MRAIISTAIIAVGIMSMVFMLTAGLATAQDQGNNTNTTSNAGGGGEGGVGFLPTNVFQDNGQIVVTITKDGQPIDGPVVVVPPTEPGGNGTIITPGDNTTGDGGNVTIIEPNGNVTEVPGGDVTVVDNSTVVIAPDDRNVTETPGNVTIIDPPQQPVDAGNGTCTCQDQNGTSGSGGGGIPPVTVIPAPGQDVTTQPAGNATDGGADGGNVTDAGGSGGGNGSGDAGGTGGNSTGVTTPPLVPEGNNTNTNSTG